MKQRKTLANVNMLISGKNDVIKFVSDYGSLIHEGKEKDSYKKND